MEFLINLVIWLVTTPPIALLSAWGVGALAGVNSTDMDRAVAGAGVALIAAVLAVVVWSAVFWGMVI